MNRLHRWLARYWIGQEHLRVWWQTIRQDRVTRYLVLPSFLIIFLGGVVVLQQAVQATQALRLKDEAAVVLAQRNAARIAELEWQVKEVEAIGSGLRQLEAEVDRLSKRPRASVSAADVSRLQQQVEELRKQMSILQRRVMEQGRVP